MPRPKFHVPLEAHGTVYFVDEAGVKGSQGQYFVTATVKTRNPDALTRKIQSVRDKNKFTNKSELKFSEITKTAYPVMCEVMDGAIDSGATFGAFILDKRHIDPWAGTEQWKGHLFSTERLLRGMATRHEVATALLDGISVPNDVSYGDELLSQINRRFGTKRFASAVSLDSRTCSGLQVADMVASAIYYYRRNVEDKGLASFIENNSPKAKLARYIADAIDLPGFADGESGLAKIKTSFPPANPINVNTAS